MTSETRKWKTEIRKTRGIRVGWQESQRDIEDSSNGMTAATLELADRLRRRPLHKKEKPHERTSFVASFPKGELQEYYRAGYWRTRRSMPVELSTLRSPLSLARVISPRGSVRPMLTTVRPFES
jgi:hypothetical protein